MKSPVSTAIIIAENFNKIFLGEPYEMKSRRIVIEYQPLSDCDTSVSKMPGSAMAKLQCIAP
jgi:hypothetical protein